MSLWEDLATQAGYSGDQASQVAMMLEEDERTAWERGCCRTPYCRLPAGHGLRGTFCEGHALRLGRLRAELDRETGQRYRIRGTRYVLGRTRDEEEVSDDG